MGPWLARYIIKAEDKLGDWELLTEDMPNSKGYEKLVEQYGDRIKYEGMYLVGNARRRRPNNWTCFETPVKANSKKTNLLDRMVAKINRFLNS